MQVHLHEEGVWQATQVNEDSHGWEDRVLQTLQVQVSDDLSQSIYACIMMVIKFVMVVSYFMHLKFDNKMFSFLFYAGLVLAIGVYAAFLATFKFFIQ